MRCTSIWKINGRNPIDHGLAARDQLASRRTEITMPPFIPAGELKQSYGVFGHFYTVELDSKETVECRSVLEIADHSFTTDGPDGLSQRQPDAVFIMMNPGSSKPLVEVNNHIRVAAIQKLMVSLVPTKPDTTQYQVMRLMHFRGWRHVRVLNLSDIRSPKSLEFIKRFQRLEAESCFESHSVFAKARKRVASDSELDPPNSAYSKRSRDTLPRPERRSESFGDFAIMWTKHTMEILAVEVPY